MTLGTMKGVISFAMIYFVVKSGYLQTKMAQNSQSVHIPRYTYLQSFLTKCSYNNTWLCPSSPKPHTKSSKDRSVQFQTQNLLVQFQSINLLHMTPLSIKPPKPNKNLGNINNSLRVSRSYFYYKKATPLYPTVYNAITQPLNDSIISSLSNRTSKIVNIRSYEEIGELHKEYLMNKFSKSLGQFERTFYQKTFNKLLSISPSGRQENGISFIQSGLFLYMALIAISTEVGSSSREEIENCLSYNESTKEKISLLEHIISWLPNSNSDLKYRWASRLVLDADLPVTQQFEEVATSVHLQLERVNGSEAPDVLTKTLNYMIEEDSGGAMHNTFEENDISDGICSVLITTMYIRPRWRSAPTVLNGTRPFHDTSGAPQRSVRMIRINDIMQYSALDEWNADVIEITYTTPGLTLLLLVPRGRSIKSLADLMATTSLEEISKDMRTTRIAATLPIYTLRMTLLLPGKLRMMGISRLVESNNSNRCNELRLSHAIQRLMFWAEAGKNAFKDDGIEWDDTPELELVVDRPYLFYVRWNNITLMNGNFVL